MIILNNLLHQLHSLSVVTSILFFGIITFAESNTSSDYTIPAEYTISLEYPNPLSECPHYIDSSIYFIILHFSHFRIHPIPLAILIFSWAKILLMVLIFSLV